MQGTLPNANFAAYADAALKSLMDNWYQFGKGSFRDLGWWNTANALETVIDYSFVRPFNNVSAIIQDVYNNRSNEYAKNFINDYYDDEAWWALAMVKAFDATQNKKYLSTAEAIFDDMLTGWDETACSGGLWWNKSRQQKNAIENELFVTLGARLYLRTGKNLYLGWAKRAWSWFLKTGMLAPNGLINDGVDLNTCGNNGKPTWTYNQGAILGGLSDLHKITGDQSYLSTGMRIASSAMTHLVSNTGILTEPCEYMSQGCGADGPQFKGIFVRYLSHLYSTHPAIIQGGAGKVTDNESATFLLSCQSFFARQAISIWNNDRSAENTLGLRWGGPFDGATASTQSSALDALVAAVPFGTA